MFDSERHVVDNIHYDIIYEFSLPRLSINKSLDKLNRRLIQSDLTRNCVKNVSGML